MQTMTNSDNLPLLRLEHVGASRRDRAGREIPLLRDITFVARQGEVTTLIGPSGGGKSTLIRLINRLTEPSTGQIFLAGEEITTLPVQQLRRRVGMVLQKPFMFEGTVLENLQRPFLYRQEVPPVAESAAVLRALTLARLDADFLARDARTLSGGEQQRVSLARALVGGPQVLLLDEPTSALDRPTADRLAATLHEICRSERLTILLVTHDLRLAGRIADYLLYLEGGQIIEEGDGKTLLSNPKSDAFKRFLAEPDDGEG